MFSGLVLPEENRRRKSSANPSAILSSLGVKSPCLRTSTFPSDCPRTVRTGLGAGDKVFFIVKISIIVCRTTTRTWRSASTDRGLCYHLQRLFPRVRWCRGKLLATARVEELACHWSYCLDQAHHHMDYWGQMYCPYCTPLVLSAPQYTKAPHR